MKLNGITKGGFQRLAKTADISPSASGQENNAYLTTHDPIIVLLYDSEETADFYVEGTLAEDGVHLPEELIIQYKEAKQLWDSVQNKLRAYLPVFV